MGRGRARAPLLVALFALVGGCHLTKPELVVELQIPETPDVWKAAWGDCAYDVEWVASAFSHGAANVGACAARFALTVPKAPLIVVLLWPRWESGGPALQPGETLRPAGCVFAPDHTTLTSSHRSAATYLSGPVAFVMATAARHGADISGFNHERLTYHIEQLSLPDPWTLNTPRIVEALIEGAMRQTYVRQRELLEFDAPVPEGDWIGASPFLRRDEVIELPVGVTPWYDANGRRLVLTVDNEGRCWSAISPPD